MILIVVLFDGVMEEKHKVNWGRRKMQQELAKGARDAKKFWLARSRSWR